MVISDSSEAIGILRSAFTTLKSVGWSVLTVIYDHVSNRYRQENRWGGDVEHIPLTQASRSLRKRQL